MGRPPDCDCNCCPECTTPYWPSDIYNGSRVTDHDYDAESWPHPYTVEEWTSGGGTVDSWQLVRGDFEECLKAPTASTTNHTLRLDLTVSGVAGRWNAGVILWIPNTAFPVEEIISTGRDGRTLLFSLVSSMLARAVPRNYDRTTGPYTVVGMVCEYDGTRYFVPYPYELVDAVVGATVWDSRCWQTVTHDRYLYAPIVAGVPQDNPNPMLPIDSGTLDYAGDFLETRQCDYTASNLTGIGLVLGVSTVGETPAEDRNATGSHRVLIDLDDILLWSAYESRCLYWWCDETRLATVTATFENAPLEINGLVVTLTRGAWTPLTNTEPDFVYTGSATYTGRDGLTASMDLVYLPCHSLTIQFPCDANTSQFTFDEGTLVDPTDSWQPINFVFPTLDIGSLEATVGNFGKPICQMTPNALIGQYHRLRTDIRIEE